MVEAQGRRVEDAAARLSCSPNGPWSERSDCPGVGGGEAEGLPMKHLLVLVHLAAYARLALLVAMDLVRPTRPEFRIQA